MPGDRRWIDRDAPVERIDLGDGAWIDHLPGWLSGHDEVMDELVRVAPWQSGERPMYDRIVAIPRLTAWWRAPFPAEVPPILESMRSALSRRYRVELTSVGCNLYRDGADSVAWHGDRVARELPSAVVALVSLGAVRPFRLRPTPGGPAGGGPSVGFRPGPGDLLVMGGSCQRTWQHSVPKCRGVGPRISVQFRHAYD